MSRRPIFSWALWKETAYDPSLFLPPQSVEGFFVNEPVCFFLKFAIVFL